MSREPALIRLAQWPRLASHAAITLSTLGCPAAMFSPQVDQTWPAAVARCPALLPLVPVWLKKLSATMSSLCTSQARVSASFQAKAATAGKLPCAPHEAPAAR